MNQILEADRRLRAAGQRWLEERRSLVEGLGRGLPDPARLIGEMSQRLDDRAERLANAVAALVTRRRERLADLGARLPAPRRQLALARERLESPAARLAARRARPRLLIDRRPAWKTLDPVREAFHQYHGLQCGFCRRGRVMSAIDRRNNSPHPNEQEIREGLEGNLCRCTGYHNIVKAIAACAEGS